MIIIYKNSSQLLFKNEKLMKKNLLILAFLCSYQPIQAIFEDCHDRIIKYTVLALVNPNDLQKDLVLSFDYHDKETDDTYAITQECARNGYELVTVKHIKVEERSILITHKLYQVQSTVKHYQALVSIKRPAIQRPLVLHFARRLALMQEDSAAIINQWIKEECLKQDYTLVDTQRIQKQKWNWRDFPEKLSYLLN